MYYSLLVLIILFSDVLFFSFLSVAGIKAQSGLLQIQLIGIFILSLLLLAKMVIYKELKNNNWIILLCVIGIGFWYFMSIGFYGFSNEWSNKILLRWVALCVPAVIIGIKAGNEADFSYIKRLLPFFIIVFTIVVAMVGITGSMTTEVSTIHDDSGLIYQNISYYMAYFFGLSGYWLIFVKRPFSIFYKTTRVILFSLMFVQAFTCVIAGGRGGAILLGCYLLIILFFVYHYVKYNKVIVFVSIVLLLLSAIYLFNYYQYNNLVGAQRILNMMDRDNRSSLYFMAIYYIGESPIYGHGLGSVFYKLGSYSHNIILDLLLEVGVIGTIAFIILYGKLLHKLRVLCKINSDYFLLLFVLTYPFVLNMFSGYWMSTHLLWFSMSIIFTLKRKRNLKFANKNIDKRNAFVNYLTSKKREN